MTLEGADLAAFIEFFRKQDDEMDEWVWAHVAKPVEAIEPVVTHPNQAAIERKRLGLPSTRQSSNGTLKRNPTGC